MPAEVETMFSAREIPWHGLGVVTDNVLTADEAIVAAGLDWTVDKEPKYRKLDGMFVPVENEFFNVRSSDQKILGNVSGIFNNLQNRDAFGFADSLVDDGSAKYETAGSLRGGKVVFLTMKVPVEMLVAGEDAHDLYLILRMGHDGSMAITAEITPIRCVCMNTLKLGSLMATQRWSIRHTSKLEGKLAQARESLNMTFAYAEEFVIVGDQLVGTKVTDDMLIHFLEDILPARPKTQDVIDGVMHNFRESDNIGNFRGTGWGALNAFTEYTDHGRDTHSQEAVFHNIMNGEIASQRDKLTTALLSV